MKILVVKPAFAERLHQSASDVLAHASSSGQGAGNDLQRPVSDDVILKYNRFRFLSMHREMQLDQIRMVAAEVVGTFMLMFSVCGIVSVTQLLGGQAVGLLEYAATGGLTITTVIFCVGPISGAHVNPAFTLAFAIFGHFSWFMVPFYVTAQLIGSVLATYVSNCVYGVNPELVLTKPLHGIPSAFWIEFIGTYMIMLLAASMLYNCKTIGHLSGIVVGIGIALAVLITGPVSGGSLNPARSLGPAIVSGKFTDVWIYIVAPCAGAISGAMTNRILRLRGDHSSPSSSVTASPDDDIGVTYIVAFSQSRKRRSSTQNESFALIQTATFHLSSRDEPLVTGPNGLERALEELKNCCCLKAARNARDTRDEPLVTGHTELQTPALLLACSLLSPPQTQLYLDLDYMREH
ncbi:unnamed protein product [Rhodiola kirilowii]